MVTGLPARPLTCFLNLTMLSVGGLTAVDQPFLVFLQRHSSTGFEQMAQCRPLSVEYTTRLVLILVIRVDIDAEIIMGSNLAEMDQLKHEFVTVVGFNVHDFDFLALHP